MRNEFPDEYINGGLSKEEEDTLNLDSLDLSEDKGNQEIIPTVQEMEKTKPFLTVENTLLQNALEIGINPQNSFFENINIVLYLQENLENLPSLIQEATMQKISNSVSQKIVNLCRWLTKNKETKIIHKYFARYVENLQTKYCKDEEFFKKEMLNLAHLLDELLRYLVDQEMHTRKLVYGISFLILLGIKKADSEFAQKNITVDLIENTIRNLHKRDYGNPQENVQKNVVAQEIIRKIWDAILQSLARDFTGSNQEIIARLKKEILFEEIVKKNQLTFVKNKSGELEFDLFAD